MWRNLRGWKKKKSIFRTFSTPDPLLVECPSLPLWWFSVHKCWVLLLFGACYALDYCKCQQYGQIGWCLLNTHYKCPWFIVNLFHCRHSSAFHPEEVAAYYEMRRQPMLLYTIFILRNYIYLYYVLTYMTIMKVIVWATVSFLMESNIYMIL